MHATTELLVCTTVLLRRYNSVFVENIFGYRVFEGAGGAAGFLFSILVRLRRNCTHGISEFKSLFSVSTSFVMMF
jgi:hypothetical protein